MVQSIELLPREKFFAFINAKADSMLGTNEIPEIVASSSGTLVLGRNKVAENRRSLLLIPKGSVPTESVVLQWERDDDTVIWYGRHKSELKLLQVSEECGADPVTKFIMGAIMILSDKGSDTERADALDQFIDSPETKEAVEFIKGA